jgi:HEAT repeat protein
MMNLRTLCLGIVALALLGLALPVLSQQANPFGDAPAAKPEAKPAAADSPFGPQRGAKKAGAAKPSAKFDPSKLPVAPSPAVEAVLESKPSTPAEMVQAASTLSMLGRADLAKQFLTRVLEAKPDDATMGALLDRFSSGFFLEMGANKDLLPESRRLADAVFAGASRFRADPKRIAALIAQLQDNSAEVRYQAMVSLLNTGPLAVEPLLSVLADPRRSVEHANVRTVLAQFKSEAVGPLVAAIEGSDPGLAVQAIAVLVEMNARDAVVYLLAPLYAANSPAPVRQMAQTALEQLARKVPLRQEAAEYLLARAEEYYQHRQPVGPVVEGHVQFWRWDAAQRRPVAKSLLPDDAQLATAARLASHAYAIAPDDSAVRRLFVAATLDAAAYAAGLDAPLPDGPGTPVATASAFDVKLLEEVLRFTVLGGHPAAATAVVRILGRKGTAEQLLASGEHFTPLVLAARHGDRRLRLAALETIVRLHPQQGFAGSSHVPESLAYFTATTGNRRVLIAGMGAEKAMHSAGALMSSGYQIDVAPNGRDMLRRALTCPDYEFALIDVAVADPTADLLLQYLRRDDRTAELPVGLVARDGLWERTEQLSRRTALTTAVWRAHDAKAIQWQAAEIAGLAARDFTPFPVRQVQAVQAMQLLAELARGDARFYDLYRVQSPVLAALANPALVDRAIPVVEALGTPESQRALVDLVSDHGQPIKTRQAAAAAFGVSIEHHGILLTTAEILRQYDRYNQSEKLDRATQLVLAAVLDSIEAPSKKLTAAKIPEEVVPTPQPTGPAAAPAPLPAGGPAAPIPAQPRSPATK